MSRMSTARRLAAGALVLSLVIRWAGLERRAYALGIRPVSTLIDAPNWIPFIVAFLAGVGAFYQSRRRDRAP